MCNGSRLGKEFSAGIFNEWWNSDEKPELKTLGEQPVTSEMFPPNPSAENKPQNIFEFLTEDTLSYNSNTFDLIEGLGGLLPDPQYGEDEEQHFENEIKRKMRKKKRR